MHKKLLVLLAVLSIAGMCLGQTTDSTAASRQDLSSITGTHEPPMLGIHWSRGFNPFARLHEAKGNNPDMTYHGGVITPSTVSEAVFWTELGQLQFYGRQDYRSGQLVQRIQRLQLWQHF